MGIIEDKIGISIIICCYNSADRLPKTIEHLAMQITNYELKWEIVIIDNASKDSTANVAKSLLQQYKHIDHTILKQPIVGKSNALNMGIKNSKYDFILTCDDDNHLNENYLTTAFDLLRADERIGVLGGCGQFSSEVQIPENISNFKAYYVNGPQDWASSDHWVYGAGSLFRKNVYLTFLKNGWIPIASGRNGSKLDGGEDVEICFMFYLSGYKILFSKELKFVHFVPKQRLNKKYLLNLQYWSNYSYILLTNYLIIMGNNEETTDKKLNRLFIQTLKKLIVFSINHAKELLIKRKEPILEERFELKACKGILKSILINKKKLVAQYPNLIMALAKTKSDVGLNQQ